MTPDVAKSGGPALQSGMPILTKIPVGSLPPAAQALAKELDGSRLVNRSDGAAQGDNELGASEVKAAVDHIGSFSAEEQGMIREWAMLLGVGAPAASSPQVKREWTALEKLPKDRTVYSAVAIGSHMFAEHGEQGYHTLSRLDPAVNTWTDVPSPAGWWWGHMNDPTLAALGNSLVAFGGHDRTGCTVLPYGYKYDVDSKQWSQMANMNTARWGMGAAEAGGKLFAMGGATSGGWDEFAFSPKGAAKSASAACEVYDPANNAWSKLPDLPVARAHAGAIAVDGKIYVVGGLDVNMNASNRVDEFDPATNAWGAPMTIPTADINPSLWLQDGKIAVSGGVNQDQQPVNTVETLDPATGKNGELAPVKFEKASYTKLAMVDGELVALGTMAGDKHYDVEAKAFRAIEQPPAPAASGGTTVVNVITNNQNNITNVDVTNVIQNITNTTVVNQLIDARTTTLQLIDNSKTTNIDVLAPVINFGFTDVDNNFFLRPQLKDKPLVRCGDHDGKRWLTGSALDGKGPLPKNADMCLYDPAAHKTFRFHTDAIGQFACNIPSDLHGRVYLFREDAGAPASSAAPLDIP